MRDLSLRTYISAQCIYPIPATYTPPSFYHYHQIVTMVWVYNHPDIPEHDVPPLFGPDANWRIESFDAAERQPIYAYVNVWIEEYGLEKFCDKKWPRNEITFLTETIAKLKSKDSATSNAPDHIKKPRSYDNVQKEIKRLQDSGRANQFGKVLARSKRLKAEILQGKKVSDKERFPEMSIILSSAPAKNRSTPKSAEMAAEKTTHKRNLQEVETQDDVLEVLVAERQKQQKELLVKLSVDWTRLRTEEDGHMSILKKVQVESSSSAENETLPTDEVYENDEPQAAKAVANPNVISADGIPIESNSQSHVQASIMRPHCGIGTRIREDARL